MTSASNSAKPRFSRQKIPLLVDDLLTVTDPAVIRAIEDSPDIARPGHPQAELPPVFRTFFKATKFQSPTTPQPQWAIPMLGADDAADDADQRYVPRLEDTRERLQRGFTPDELAIFDALARGDPLPILSPSAAVEDDEEKEEKPCHSEKDDLREICAACAKLVAPLLIPLDEGESLPDDIAYACYDTLTDFMTMLNPVRYVGARKAREVVEEYVKAVVPEAESENRVIDYVHNLGAAAQGLGKAMMTMRAAKRQGKDAEEMTNLEALVADPIVPSVLRVPICTTTVGALLPEDKPLVPGKTVIVVDIGAPLTETGDASFMFGTGSDVRQCPFKGLFLSTLNGMEERQSE